jgi:hypothetical protein
MAPETWFLRESVSLGEVFSSKNPVSFRVALPSQSSNLLS